MLFPYLGWNDKCPKPIKSIAHMLLRHVMYISIPMPRDIVAINKSLLGDINYMQAQIQ